MVSSTQPAANSAGIAILNQGGNCVDACVAIAACLAVIEPAMTGIGGDCFALFYDAKEKKVSGLNGCGRAAKALSIDFLRENYADHILPNRRFKGDSIFKVTVPGAVCGWFDAFTKWGSGNLSMQDILQPAIELAENGFVVAEINSLSWKSAVEKLRRNNIGKDIESFLPKGESPEKGDLICNPDLAETLKRIAIEGKNAFYNSDITDDIISEMNGRGHVFSREDFTSHESTFVEPIGYEFLGKKLWEIPPNGSGIIALITLGMIKNLDASGVIDLKEMKHNSADYLHLIIETLKLAFKESEEYVFDYDHYSKETNEEFKGSIERLLSDDYLREKICRFNRDSTLLNEGPDSKFKSDTVYFTAVDKYGNACSFINSVYESFGSGIVIPKRGFTMQNRGGNFSLNPKAKNSLQGGKRPYHTIIPGMITEAGELGELYASYGIMGGYNQPQAHVQVYMNMIFFGMDPQEALDAPRICLSSHPKFKHTDSGFGADGPASTLETWVDIEEGIEESVIEELRCRGHKLQILDGFNRKQFGRGQIIRREKSYFKKSEVTEDSEVNVVTVFSGGSDMRGDGAAVPQV
ncbi:hypothetical protein CANINC_004934 [Pichia inconspicua]|uniref:Gamma-glutamyltransferase n=1 Tax=Pichia inconspicua TaxID=52247 RepID=A0A4T0WWB0_9ASCO|nr:hypothetical protein CANINC_004934 [[Candida] inconspicua]